MELFTYRVIWGNPVKNRQEFADFREANIALFVAREKVVNGMVNVEIRVERADMAPADSPVDDDDPTWPGVDVEIFEKPAKNIG